MWVILRNNMTWIDGEEYVDETQARRVFSLPSAAILAYFQRKSIFTLDPVDRIELVDHDSTVIETTHIEQENTCL
jgi:hypothetical protein